MVIAPYSVLTRDAGDVQQLSAGSWLIKQGSAVASFFGANGPRGQNRTVVRHLLILIQPAQRQPGRDRLQWAIQPCHLAIAYHLVCATFARACIYRFVTQPAGLLCDIDAFLGMKIGASAMRVRSIAPTR